MVMGYKKQFGQKGEDLACAYLRKNRYKIVERNFRLRNAEIDIIGIDTSSNPQTLAFIEVKTRTSNSYGEPLEAIGYYKLQAMNRAALYYQMSHPHLPKLLRLDAISIRMNDLGEVLLIDLLKNIG
jgi:putative endonuclease